jgi:hypothetical protein
MIEMHKKTIELKLKRRKLLIKRKPMIKKLKMPPRNEHDPRISCHVHVTNLFNI